MSWLLPTAQEWKQMLFLLKTNVIYAEIFLWYDWLIMKNYSIALLVFFFLWGTHLKLKLFVIHIFFLKKRATYKNGQMGESSVTYLKEFIGIISDDQSEIVKEKCKWSVHY